MNAPANLPVVIIGGGPVGLAAAAEMVERGLPFLVLEEGPNVGASVRRWAHVRTFSPWEYNVSPAERRLLSEIGWTEPTWDENPTGGDLVKRLLEPLAAHPKLRGSIRLASRVVSVSRRHHDALRDGREGSRKREPLVVRVRGIDGEADLLASAVVDASGTWTLANPLGASGTPALGEEAARAHPSRPLSYGIPDVLGSERERFANRRVLVVGGGHSAQGVVQDLSALRVDAPGTTIVWALRAANLNRVIGGGERDQLPGRGLLGLAVKKLVEGGGVDVLTSFAAESLRLGPAGWMVASEERELGPFDQIVVATGFRPDLSLSGELRVAIDPATQAPANLAPLIDPNVHSCGTVPPHGEAELRHPEAGFYVVGMKSYGRAPTFLLRTGYEQVRSVVAALAGDIEAARRVELVLPETGVCSAPAILKPLAPLLPAARAVSAAAATVVGAVGTAVGAVSGCCGGPSKSASACCVADEDAKAQGAEGCGCGV